jgi:NitT/TauT family transport system substrate-binding protein
MDKGYFKEANLDVDKIESLEGPAAISALLEGKLAYAEVSPLAVMQASRKASALRIISDNVPTFQDVVWVALLSSPVNSLQDLGGRRLGYSNLGTSSQAANLLALEKVGVPASTITLSRTGGVEAGLSYLQLNAIDAMPVPEPTWSARMNASKYKVIGRASGTLGESSNVVGVTTPEAAASKPGFIRGVIRARQTAIEYMRADPHGAATIVARIYNIDAPVIEAVIRALLQSERDTGVEYWASGEFRPGRSQQIDALGRLLRPGVDAATFTTVIDESFLAGKRSHDDAAATWAQAAVARAIK